MRRAERGQALTELAILLPVILVMFYGSSYLWDLASFKLRSQEIARYGVFAAAARPLSDYEDLRHNDAFTAARDSVEDELDDVYIDLDGSRNLSFLGTPLVQGKSLQTMSGIFQGAQVRQDNVSIFPDWASVEWAEPLSGLGIVLQLLGIGTGTNSMGTSVVDRLGMNGKGQITVRPDVRIQPPIRPSDAARARALSGMDLTVQTDNDLSRWRPPFRIREFGGEPISMTLIADSWRLQQGFTAHPKSGKADRHFGNVVDEVSKNAITALPFGQILAAIAALEGFSDNLPSFLNILIGIPPESPSAHVFSRPYNQSRSHHPHYTGTPHPGQVDIIREADGDNQEGGVRNFESGAFYLDAQNPEDSGYVEMLRLRGNHFMGCDTAQTRGCWE